MIHPTTKMRPLGVLALTIAVAAALAPAVLAQTPGANTEPEQTLDTMIVTGSRIPTAEEVGSSPVDTVSEQDIERTGTNDVLSILQRSNPGFVGGGNLGSSNANISSNSTYGGSTISLRNLPTLVLIDGRRITDSSAAAAGGSAFTDVNLIPVAMVDRIEVLKDGASAIYGSEAVGGVVNIILKKDFQGVEAGGRYGFAQERSAAGDRIVDYRAYALAGISTERVRAVFGLQYAKADPIFSRDRSFAVPSFGTTNYAGVAADNDNYYLLNPGLSSPANTNVTGPGATATGPLDLTPGTYRVASQDEVVNGFDLSQGTSQTLDSERTNFYSNVEFDVLDKGALTVFGNFLYATSTSSSQLNAQPLNNFSGIVIPAGSPYNPFINSVDTDDVEGSGDGLEPNLVANRYTSNPRIFSQDNDFYRALGGVKGSLFGGKLTYESAYTYSENTINFRNDNLINGQNINDAIAGGYDAAGNAVEGGAYSIVAGNLQPALDFFARQESLPDGALNGVFGTDIQDLKTTQKIFDISVYGSPVTLPAGDFGVLAGYEYRKETLVGSSGPNIFIGGTPISAIDVGRDVSSIYGQINLPLLGGDLTYPGFYRLNVDASFRNENFSDAGESTVPKIGFTFQPIPDLTIRGTYSESFIAPTLYSTQGPVSVGFTDPIILNGVEETQAQSQSGSNINLEPSTADTYSLGLVYSPKFVKGLTVSATYFAVNQQDIVGVVGAQTILEDVEANGTASPYAGQVHFSSFTGPTVTGAGQISGNLNRVFVTDTLQNLGGQNVEGYDFDIKYRMDIASDHAVTIGASAVYFTTYEIQNLQTDPFVDVIKTNNGDALGNNLPEYRINAFIAYELGGLTADILFNYQPRTLNATSVALTSLDAQRPTLEKIEEYYTFDARLGYEFGKNKSYESASSSVTTGKETVTTVSTAAKTLLDGLTIAAGVNNIFDREPPFIDGGTDNTDLAAFDPTGRFFYFEVTKKF